MGSVFLSGKNKTMKQMNCCFQDEDYKSTKYWLCSGGSEKEMATVSVVPKKYASLLQMPIKHYATVNLIRKYHRRFLFNRGQM